MHLHSTLYAPPPPLIPLRTKSASAAESAPTSNEATQAWPGALTNCRGAVLPWRAATRLRRRPAAFHSVTSA